MESYPSISKHNKMMRNAINMYKNFYLDFMGVYKMQINFYLINELNDFMVQNTSYKLKFKISELYARKANMYCSFISVFFKQF